MKIALVRARYNPYGGAERFAARTLEALAGDEAEVAVLARRWDAAGGAPGRIRLVRCDPFYLGSVWRDASFARAVVKAVAREGFDLVQSHERIAGLPVYRAGDGVHAAWLARRARMADGMTRLGMALNPHHRYLVDAERVMFEHPALRAVICNSAMVRREIAEGFAIDRDKLFLIRNGVDLDRFHPGIRGEGLRAATRERLGIPREATVFVLVGSGFERKGVAPALDALRAVDGAWLCIVGHDKHADRYRRAAERLGVGTRVRFVGPVGDPLPFYAMADAFCLPTLYDPFPNAALEALACGLPLVTTDGCGAAEIIDEGVSGWIVPAGSVDRLAIAMGKAAHAIAARRDATTAAARRAAEPWSLGVLTASLMALYRRLLDRT